MNKCEKNKRATLYVHDEQKHYLYQTTKSKLKLLSLEKQIRIFY